MKFLFIVFSLIIFPLFLFAQNPDSLDNDLGTRPKLVIGIVVDQMRYDYLTRFYTQYGEGGFKRMLREGYNFKNNHFNYIPTFTGPGHTSVYTGTSPAVHGIIANTWYDKTIDENVYCTQDDEMKPLGTDHKSGKMSPGRMKTTSITDELRLASQLRSKVIGIAIKDRGAILPAGHSANAAYWFRGKDEGNWISSSFYMDMLPKWVTDFNTSGKKDYYLNQTWETLYPIENYTQSGPDDVPFEKLFKGKEKPVFPYDLKKLVHENGNYDMIRETPFGSNITTDFAIAAIEGENLGKDEFTDFLAISYSSPDYIGHNFGINSKEIQDTYLRLDKDLERLFNYLDKNVGEENYMVFLTADHGAVHTPAYLQSLNIPAGYFDNDAFQNAVNEHLKNDFNTSGLIANISNEQIFLNHETVQKNNLDASHVQKSVAEFVLQYPQIDKVYTRDQMENTHYSSGTGYLLQNGFNQKRSGDVLYVPDPAVISAWYTDGGTTHGSGYTYDTHVPLLFFGKGIVQGSSHKKSEIVDIAPTLSAYLGISRPNGATGRVLDEMLDK